MSRIKERKIRATLTHLRRIREKKEVDPLKKDREEETRHA